MVLALINLSNYKKDFKVKEFNKDGFSGGHETKELKSGECLFYPVREDLGLKLKINSNHASSFSHNAKDRDGREMHRKLIIDWVYSDGESVPSELIPDEWKTKEDNDG